MAESFGIDPERYDRARPPYPAALIERIVDGRTGMSVLDVGCGTGIEARQLAHAGCRVLGIEPDPRMAEHARSRGTEVEIATFEAWEPGGRLFDAVVAGQSWHWVDPVLGADRAADVLGTGGRIILFSHVFAPPPDIAEASALAIRRILPDADPGVGAGRDPVALYERMYRGFAEHLVRSARFHEPEEWRFDGRREYSTDEWLDLQRTTGLLTRLAPDDLTPVLDEIGRAIEAAGGGFTLETVTLAVAAERGA